MRQAPGRCTPSGRACAVVWHGHPGASLGNTVVSRLAVPTPPCHLIRDVRLHVSLEAVRRVGGRRLVVLPLEGTTFRPDQRSAARIHVRMGLHGWVPLPRRESADTARLGDPLARSAVHSSDPGGSERDGVAWSSMSPPICSWAFQKHLEFRIATTKVITKESVSGLLQS